MFSALFTGTAVWKLQMFYCQRTQARNSAIRGVQNGLRAPFAKPNRNIEARVRVSVALADVYETSRRNSAIFVDFMNSLLFRSHNGEGDSETTFAKGINPRSNGGQMQENCPTALAEVEDQILRY